MQENGYFTADVFPDVIRHLMECAPSSQKLFILDGHDSHTSVEALDL
jgi:hypothetical protein